jgi:sarcosine oxidase subunit beta
MLKRRRLESVLMPQTVDILVIGGGLAGCAMAYFLAREGADVVLLEERDLNSLASGANSGSLHAQIPYEPFVAEGESFARTFQPVVPLMLQSIELWQALERELDTDFEVNISGGILVADSDAQMSIIRRKIGFERAAGLPVHEVSAAELRSIAPYLSDRATGGSLCTAEGKANPLKAGPALAAAAERLGARIFRNQPVIGAAAEPSGFLIRTPSRTFRARRVVNCAGAQAARIAGMVGLTLAIEGFPIQASITEPIEPLVSHLIYSAGDRLTLKQTRHGGVVIGGGWAARLNPDNGRPSVESASVPPNLRAAVNLVPALASVHLLRTWPAVVNGTADWRPIFGAPARLPGFFSCVFPWMGFTAGPIAARLVADLVMGRKPPEAFAQFFL